MSCIYLEITRGTAWGLMNSQTAGNSPPAYFQQNYLQLFVSLSIAAIFPFAWPQQQTCPVRQQGPSICAGCVPPPPVSSADPRLTVGLSQRKAIFLTAWLLFQGQCRSAARTPTSRAPTGLFRKSRLILSRLSPFCVHLPVTPQQKKN